MKPNKPQNTVHLISLGCAKNTVDSSSMAELLARAGYQLTEHAGRAGVIIVNTCGFIGLAREESFQVLGDLAAHKRKGQLLIAAGCLTQRYGAEVARRVPGIDGILGTRRWMDIVEVVQKLHHNGPLQSVYHFPETPTIGSDEHNVRRVAVQGGSAYIKIADGCRRPCAFCAIPLIKGTAVSRPMEAILEEARFLGSQGVREINLIAQDTTDYGYDLGLKDGLALLLDKMTDPALYGQTHVSALDGQTRGSASDGQARGFASDGQTRGSASDGQTRGSAPAWIRVLYAYPGYVTDRLIEVMASRPQIMHYLDMPLQHAHPDTLRRMRRPANIDWVYHTLEKMRSQIPDLALRTTFIVGYPGETEEEFQTLLDFVKAIRFDRVGAFQFSFEAGAPSEPLGDPIPPEVKEDRYNRLMELQQGISLEINQSFVGKTLPVLIEGQGEAEVGAGLESNSDDGEIYTDPPLHPHILIGRSYRDAPEIDGVVVVERENHSPYAEASLIGEIIPVHITGAMAYDLTGIPDGGITLDVSK